MAASLLALSLFAAGNPGGLGVGLDVLPQAFTFAANRLRFSPDLRLARCDATTCRWDAGEGIELTASLAKGGLDVGRIEADVAYGGAGAPAAVRARFEMVCRGIVALTVPDVSIAETHTIAQTITDVPERRPSAEIDTSTHGVDFYGRRTTPTPTGDGKSVVLCGAVADAGERAP